MTSSLLSGALFAGNTPSAIKFEEGEQFNASLSRLNYSRIFVEGESIVKVSFPENAFIVEKTKPEDDDPDGSVYLKPLANIPLTVFFTTNENHHFALTIKPSDELGKSVKFVSKGLKGFDYAQSKEVEKYKTNDAMTSIIEGKTPDGFKEIKTIPGSFNLHKNLRLTLVKQYRGKDSSAYVYRVENISNNSVELEPSLFENNKLLSLELSEKNLAPKQAGYLYGFYRDGQGIG